MAMPVAKAQDPSLFEVRPFEKFWAMTETRLRIFSCFLRQTVYPRNVSAARLTVMALLLGIHLSLIDLLNFGADEPHAVASQASVLQVSWLGSAQAAVSLQPSSPEPKIKPRSLPVKPETAEFLKDASSPVLTTTAAALATSTVSDMRSVASGETAPTSNSTSANSTSAAAIGSGASGGGDAGVEAPKFDAAYLSNPTPEYPKFSRELGEHGRVYLRVHVAAEGVPQEIVVHQSSGFERLDRAAIKGVGQWHFVAGRREGKAIAGWVIVPINFILRR